MSAPRLSVSEARARTMLEKYRNADDACEAQMYADQVSRQDADIHVAEREADDSGVEMDVEGLFNP